MYLEMDCSCRGRNLDKMLQPGILLCVRDGKKFGYQIIEELGDSPMFDGVRPDKTGVYRYLKRMEMSSYLEAGSAIDPVDEKSRKCYAIAEKGRACLESWGATLREYAYSLSQLVEEIETGAEEDVKVPEGITADSPEPGTVTDSVPGRSAQDIDDEKKDRHMTDLYLITGFLGAGKSTFLKRFLKLFEGKKIQLIINEFGAEDVDGVLLGNLGVELEEITGGSVFCSCRIDQFEKALRTFVEEDTDVVIVEASGLSDPTGVHNLLYESERFPHIRYKGSICMIDAIRFPKVYAKSRTCVKQVAAADLALINKIDKAKPEDLEKTRQLVRDQRPDLMFYETSFGETDADLLTALDQAKANTDATMPLTADLTTRKLAVKVKSGIKEETLEHFLKLFVETTFRVKGFVETEDKGMCLVSCVGTLMSIEPYGAEVPEDRIGTLVILSGAGMPVRKAVKEAIKWYPEEVEMLI
ncbi:MAG: helix-turn-helix transcriptional regulator [Eubacterium sp.]|nr:helix-turn-helix transcriptional regulator [Eubacterium sp.]